MKYEEGMSDCVPHIGAVTGNGYGNVWRNGKQYGAHRWAYMRHNGVSEEDIRGRLFDIPATTNGAWTLST